VKEHKSIHLSLIINSETLSTNRNEDEKRLSIDISDNDNLDVQNVRLAPNPDGYNPKSVRVIQDIKSFFYIYSPYPVVLNFTQADGTEFQITTVNVCIMQSPFESVEVINKDIEQSLLVKLIYT
jgi:hypothetical protein